MSIEPKSINTRIAWFSPISFQSVLRSSIFTSEVFANLPLDWEVTLFVDDDSLEELRTSDPDSGTESLNFGGVPVKHYLQASLLDEQNPFDLFVFQIEDSPRCQFVMTSMEVWPGVCRFHDLNLHHLELSRVAYCTTGELLDERLEEEGGVDQKGIGEWKARGWSTEVMENKYSFIEHQLRVASLIMVEDGWAVSGVESKTTEIPAELVPFPVRVPSPVVVDSERFLMRANLGLSPEQKVVAYCGKYRLEDRVYQVLESMKALNHQKPQSEQVVLLWVVATAKEELFAQGAIEKILGAESDTDWVLVVRADGSSGFIQLLSAADAMIGLKYGPFRGVGLEVYQCMARGIPAIVSRFGAASDLPNSAVMKVDVGEREVLMLHQVLEHLFMDKDLRNAVGQGGREYASVLLSPSAVIGDLQQLFENYRSKLAQKLEVRRADYRKSSEKLLAGQFERMSSGLEQLDVAKSAVAINPLRERLNEILSSGSI